MPLNRSLYPANWSEISEFVRFTRAGGRCECTGVCGVEHGAARGERCPARHFDLTYFDPFLKLHVFISADHLERQIAARYWLLSTDVEVKTIYLTTAHLWRGACRQCAEKGIKCGDVSHLLAMCAPCHLLYDMPHNVENRKKTLSETFDRERGLFEILQTEK